MFCKNRNKWIAALVSGLSASAANASGFQLLEQSASGIGNAFAGSAAVAENAGTVFYNPAGMTKLQGLQVSGGVTAIRTSFTFSNGGSSTGSLAGNGGDGGSIGYVPNGYIAKQLNQDLYVGLGIGAPFGLQTKYDNPWAGGAQSLKFGIKTLNINPSLAYRLNETVSLGLGADYQKIDAEYRRIAGTGLVPTGLPAPFPAAVDASTITTMMKLKDDAWGWNAGVLLTLSPSTTIGVSYRSTIKYKTTGDVKLSSDGTVAGATALAILTGAGRASNVAANLTLPDTWVFSGKQVLSNQWEALADVSLTRWSTIPKLDIMRTSGALAGQVAQTLDTNFRDAWRVALGANYKYSDAVKLRFGVAYDQTPVKGSNTRLVSLPDNDRIWLSFGTQWAPAKDTAVDVGVAYLYVKDAQINNDQTAAARGLVSGTFSDSAWILGAQYSARF